MCVDLKGSGLARGGCHTPPLPPPSPTGQCLWRVGWRILPLLGSPHIGVLQSLILVYWRPAFCLSYYAPNSGDQVCSFINIEDQFCSQYLGPVLLLIARGPTVVLWLLQSGVGGKQVIGEWQQEVSSHQHAKWHITQNLPNTQNNVSHKMKWHKTQSLPNTQTNVAYNENDTKHKLQRCLQKCYQAIYINECRDPVLRMAPVSRRALTPTFTFLHHHHQHHHHSHHSRRGHHHNHCHCKEKPMGSEWIFQWDNPLSVRLCVCTSPIGVCGTFEEEKSHIVGTQVVFTRDTIEGYK